MRCFRHISFLTQWIHIIVGCAVVRTFSILPQLYKEHNKIIVHPTILYSIQTDTVFPKGFHSP